MPHDSQDKPAAQVGVFATTHWSVVLAAQREGSTCARDALSRLCQTYWYPLYAHARRRGLSPQDAEDAVQGFFAALLERQPFERLSPEQGRFRSFLLAALDNFLADARDRRNALKRGGGQPVLSLDAGDAENRYGLEAAAELPPDKAFDRRWAMTVLEQALDALATEQAATGKAVEFERLQPFLADTTAHGDYAVIAKELGQPLNTVAAKVRRLRQRYRELVRAEIAHTITHPAEIETEMGHLLAALRG
jgi:RNA polymerase sigma factor (sigma-70 family)